MIGYTKGGREIQFDSPECYARIEQADSEEDTTYTIRIDRTRGECFDPMPSLSSGKSGDKMLGTVDKYPFISVSKEAFQQYLKYLQTSNRAYLTNSNRSLRWG